MGALSTDPRQPGQRGANALRQERLQAQRQKKAGGALGTNPAAAQPVQTASTQPAFDQATTSANNYLNSTLGQLQNQGQFNPGDYSQSRQQATDTAMNEFNRMNKDRFAQEDQSFNQNLLDQGVDPASEKGRNLAQQHNLSRSSEIQGAQNNAFQLGQGEQAQAYNQQYSTFNQPLNQLQAMSPYYGYQNQNQQAQLDRNFTQQQTQGGYDFQREMAKLQQKYSLQLQNNAPRGGGGGGGGGGLSYDQQLGLVDRNFYNNMVLSGMQNGQQVPYPGAAGGAAQGVGNGVAVGLGAGLR
jgi:hypothetical protein